MKLPFPLLLPVGCGGVPEVSDNSLFLPNDVHRNRLVGRGVSAVARDAAVAWTDGVRRDQPVLAVEPRRVDASFGAENADAAVGNAPLVGDFSRCLPCSRFIHTGYDIKKAERLH